MDDQLEERYFQWLFAKVDTVYPLTHDRDLQTVLRILDAKEFVWLISGDDNRAEFGRGLRLDFLTECVLISTDDWETAPCSVLEMLIAFADIVAFELDAPMSDCFWSFLDTLGLSGMSDTYGVDEVEVESILDTLIWRTYEYDGTGGLFPLKVPTRDQREVEIWYQFCAHAIECELI